MKILATGVTGFLGERVALALGRAGHSVRGFVRNAARWKERPEGAEIAVGDVTDRGAVRRAVDGCDAVVHMAALVRVWDRDPRHFDRVNVGGLRNAWEAAQEVGARLFYTSSFIALGPTDGRVFDEDTPRATERTHNDYERTKLAADRLARSLAAGGADLVRLYPGVVYGPGPLTAGNHVVHLLLEHARGKLPGILGRGDLRQCFAFVEDVAAGYVAAVDRASPGSGYILGGENRTATELFESFRRASGIAPPKRHVAFWFATLLGKMLRWRAELTGAVPDLTDQVVGIYRHEWAYSSRRAEADLGYRITPLDEGVARTVRWLRSAGELPGGA